MFTRKQIFFKRPDDRLDAKGFGTLKTQLHVGEIATAGVLRPDAQLQRVGFGCVGQVVNGGPACGIGAGVIAELCGGVQPCAVDDVARIGDAMGCIGRSRNRVGFQCDRCLPGRIGSTARVRRHAHPTSPSSWGYCLRSVCGSG